RLRRNIARGARRRPCAWSSWRRVRRSSSRGASRSMKRSASRSSAAVIWSKRSEEHTSELQSRFDLVCRLLLEKKKHNHENLHRAQHVRLVRPLAVDVEHALLRRTVPVDVAVAEHTLLSVIRVRLSRLLLPLLV